MLGHHITLYLSLAVIICSGCTSSIKKYRDDADRLNKQAYVSRYKNLELTRQYAQNAYDYSVKGRYSFGKCDALVNLAFYNIARMKYAAADSLLLEAQNVAPDNTSKLCAEVLEMRLCQRRSLNKDFFVHKFKAEKYISRIHNTINSLNQHQREHYTWARSEYGIVLSAYLYYLGHEEESSKVLLNVADDHDIYLRADTAQWLNYLYNVGSGGIIRNASDAEVKHREIDMLMQCYISSSHLGYLFWEANSLQSLSEHLSTQGDISILRDADAASLRYLNDNDSPDSLLSMHLSEKALEDFVRYGDVYQSAAAWRTLADCYFRQNDYEAMLNCLLNAMSDSLVYQAPTIVASINERLCVAYSAINDKPTADYIRNQYLDIQDSIRQDRQLEARTDALTSKVRTLQIIVVAIIAVIFILGVFIFVMIKYRKGNNVKLRLASLTDRIEELQEQENMLNLQISDARRLNIEEHAKVSLVQSLQPLIDRMRVASQHDLNDTSTLEYLNELCKSVEQGNEQLTKWIQLRKGSVKLHVETFPIQELFDMLSLNTVSFTAKGVSLRVNQSPLKIKADKTLTMFLLNTIVDNARKFTEEGGTITVSCDKSEIEGYADISIQDTGKGMSQDDADHLFEYRVIDNAQEDLSQQKSHGFGLMNCRGIMDHYRKTSNIFANATIQAFSKVGEGTKIIFRLPYIAMSILTLLMCCVTLNVNAAGPSDASKNIDADIARAESYCDSMYYCNINARYSDCLHYYDLCRTSLNVYFLKHKGNPKDTLSAVSGEAELKWFRQGLKVDYELILAMRNEAAVAALSLHEWDVYKYNNSIYTSLYHEYSSDSSLNNYYERMQNYESVADLSLIILVSLIVALIAIFYRFYIRDFIIAKDKYRKMIAELEDKISVLESERNKLHVAISISENCLSTIKHETMYYPSRIAHLVGAEGEEKTLCETISFYQRLYALLSSHCQKLQSDGMMQIIKIGVKELFDVCKSYVEVSINIDEVEDCNVLADEEMLKYLFLILKKKNGGVVVVDKVENRTDLGYLILNVRCSDLRISDEQMSTMFSVQSHDVDFLVIKQILREIGDKTHRYGSGISAISDGNGIIFHITLPVA